MNPSKGSILFLGGGVIALGVVSFADHLDGSIDVALPTKASLTTPSTATGGSALVVANTVTDNVVSAVPPPDVRGPNVTSRAST
jgi:hypothetical protein